MSLNFNQPSKSLLIDLINTKATKTLASSDLEIGTPEVSSENDRDTKIALTASAQSTIVTGSTTFYYNRVDLGEMFEGHETHLTFNADETEVTDLAGLIAHLVVTFNLGISADDLKEVDFNLSSKPNTVTIEAAETSLVYKGSFDINFLYADTKEDLATVLANNVAEGFEKPTISVAG